MPESLPSSILNQALPRSFLENQAKRKTTEKFMTENKANSGMSDRLLCNYAYYQVRTSSGLSRNYFAKISSEKNCNPRLSTNNFFNTNTNFP